MTTQTTVPLPWAAKLVNQCYGDGGDTLSILHQPKQRPALAMIAQSIPDLHHPCMSIEAKCSPLLVLQHFIREYFHCKPSIASFMYVQLEAAVRRGETKVDLIGAPVLTSDLWAWVINWTSARHATCLVMMLAARKESMFAAMKAFSTSLNGIPDLKVMRQVPTASLTNAYYEARTAARIEGKTTVLGIGLFDVHWLQLKEIKEHVRYSPFTHTFTMGIGPEGFILWQAGGEGCPELPTLDEYLAGDGDCVHDWVTGEVFIGDFEELVTNPGIWNSKRNKLYNSCFPINIDDTVKRGIRKPMTPKFEAWVRIYKLRDVKVEDVDKFEWTMLPKNWGEKKYNTTAQIAEYKKMRAGRMSSA